MGRDVASSFDPAATARVVEALQRGQELAARDDPRAALACYDEAATIARSLPTTAVEARRLQGVVAMNRGNALQKISAPDFPAEAVRAYDEAIARFETLPHDAEPAFRNHLGAAWLNRGHALLAHTDTAKAIKSFELAAAHFEQLPLGADISYRLNLAGARANLAHVLFTTEPDRARAFAQAALALLDGHERAHPAFTGMSLRVRRALVMAIGNLLQSSTGILPVGSRNHDQEARATQTALLAEATDTIDEGLALARDFVASYATHLRPLALRLFRLGAQLYGTYQPHFLAEFVLENLVASPFASDPDFRAAAHVALSRALTELQKPQRLTIGDAAAAQALATAHSLRAAQHRLSALSA